MILRHCTEGDLDGYAAVQEEEWGEAMAASRGQLETRLEHVAENMLVVEHDGEVVAGASFVRLSHYDLDEHLSWNELTDEGWCTNHRPDGAVLFGVDLSVSRRAPRTASARLFAASMELTMRRGVEATYWGSRLPRYHRHADRMTADEYVRARTARGRHLDPEIELYRRAPGVELVGVVPDYFKDVDSLNYGCVLRWPNPIHRYPFLRPLSPLILRGLFRLDHRRKSRQRRATTGRN